MHHQQEQQYLQQTQPESNTPAHLTSVEHYPIYSSNHLDARPIPTFFTQTQKPHFLMNLLQGFQKPWELTTTKPTYVYMNSRPLASLTMTTSTPPRPALADSSGASSQSVSQTTGYRGKTRIPSKLHFFSRNYSLDWLRRDSQIAHTSGYGVAVSCEMESSCFLIITYFLVTHS